MASRPKRPVVAFIFAIVRRHPTTSSELGAIPAIADQRRLITLRIRRGDITGKKTHYALTTYRQQRFVDNPRFARACSDARALDADLLIGDVFGSMRNLDPENALHCLRMLDALDIGIINAFDGRKWSAYSVAEKQGLFHAEKTRSQLRGNRIKSGLPKTDGSSGSDMRSRQGRAAAALTDHANKRALEFESVVREIIATQGSRELSASQLSRDLNARGLHAPRGGNWSPVTAGRLLRRLRDIEKIDSEA